MGFMGNRGFLIGGTLGLWILLSGIAATAGDQDFVSWPTSIYLAVVAFALAFTMWRGARRRRQRHR